MPPAASKPLQALELLGSRMRCIPEDTCDKPSKEIPTFSENAFGLVSDCFLLVLQYPVYPVLTCSHPSSSGRPATGK